MACIVHDYVRHVNSGCEVWVPAREGGVARCQERASWRRPKIGRALTGGVGWFGGVLLPSLENGLAETSDGLSDSNHPAGAIIITLSE